MKTTYTPEQKRQYFANLRETWKSNKAKADNDTDAKTRYEGIKAEGLQSYYSFYFTLMEMKSQGLEGNPYVDCKTFNGWRAAGFKVNKGEKSKIRGITWLSTSKDEENDDKKFVFPKMYHLFHRSQVSEL